MNEIVSSAEQSGYITIPCPPDKLGEFISGLLGKPQIIKKFLYGRLKLEREDVINLHLLVDERIREQQKAILVQLSLTILYNDGSSVELGSLEDFRSYNEIRPLICIGVSYTAIYLIQFVGKPVAERQQIDVDFRIANRDKITGQSHVRQDDRLLSAIHRREFDENHAFDTGLASFRIAHTARSWGADVEALLSNHISNLITRDNDATFRRLVSTTSDYIGFGIFGATGASLIWGGYRYLSYISKERLSALGLPAQTNADLTSNDGKLDFLVRQYAVAPNLGMTLLIVLAVIVILIISIAAAIWISSFTSRPRPSFLLMSRKSTDYQNEKESEYTNGPRNFLLTSSLAITLNVIASIVFYYIW